MDGIQISVLCLILLRKSANASFTVDSTKTLCGSVGKKIKKKKTNERKREVNEQDRWQ